MKLHPNARTTPYAREQIVDRVLRLGWSVEDAAQAAAVSVRTAYRWMARYRAEGVPGLQDRTCTPRRIVPGDKPRLPRRKSGAPAHEITEAEEQEPDVASVESR